MPTRFEKRLTEIWTELLKRPDVELHKDFLDLGGDSLSAMLCISRIEADFSVSLPLEDFFIEPATVISIAKTIEDAVARQSEH